MKENETNTRVEVAVPNDKMVEDINKILSNRTRELNYKMRLLITQYIVLMRISCNFLWWILITGYIDRYLRKVLKKYFFLLLKLLLYSSLLFLFLALLSGLGDVIYPLNIITDFCYDTLIAWYNWI